MLRKLAAVALVLGATATAAFGAMGSPLKGVVVAYKMPSGLPTDAVAKELWSRPPSISRFEYTKLYLPTDRQTDLRVAYDDKNLYLAYRTLITELDKPVSKAKSGSKEVFSDDCALAAIDTDSDRNTYVCLATNSLGERYAEYAKQYIHKPWNGKWSTKASIGKDAWTVVTTVPFSSLGVSTPRPGTEWAVNFERGYQGGKAPSTWIKATRRAWDMYCRGKLVFAGTDWPFVSIPIVKIQTPGRQSVKLGVINPGATSVDLVVTALCDGTRLEPTRLSAARGRSEIEVGIDYPYDGWHDINITVEDVKGKTLACTSSIPIRMAACGTRLAKCSVLLGQLSPSSEAAKSEMATVQKTIRELDSELRSVGDDAAKWKAMMPRVEATEKAIGHLRCVCSDTGGSGYAVGTESALRKILRELLFEGEFGAPAKVSLAGNEFESTQVAVIAHDKALKGVSVSVSDLAEPGGAVISKDRIGLNLVDFVKTGEPPYEMQYRGWHPDPLMPNAAFDLAQGDIRPIWITVHTAEGTPAGLYKGAVTIKPENAPAKTVPLEVTVWGFSIPTKPALKTAFALSEKELEEWYGEPLTDQRRLAWYQLLLDHRINPTNIYSKEPVPRFDDMQYCVDRGLNAFSLTVTWGKSPEKLKELLAKIKDYQGPLQEKGWWDMAYVYGFDELGSDRFEELNYTYGAIRKAFPGLPTMTTIVPCPELKGSVDIWVPLLHCYDPEWCNKFVKDGDQVWWYVCCGPRHPYPNYFVDYPAIDPRILSWMNWKYQVPGMLYYMTNLWRSNRVNDGPGIHAHNDPETQKAIAAGKRWPEIPWNTHTCAGFNGDGHLLYPGLGGQPLASIRLVSIRDGIDDYDYFAILDSLVKKAEAAPADKSPLLADAKKLLAVSDSVVRSTTEYTLDPDALLSARANVANMIERLSK